MSQPKHLPASQAGSQQDTLPPTSTQMMSPWGRQMRQLGLFFAGAGFLAASVAVSRRSVMRKQLASLPKFYSSNRNPVKVDSSERSLLAVEALGLATLNVMSFAIFLTGGLSWAFDLCSVKELQQRTHAAVSRTGTVNPEDEKELEEMMDSLLAKLGMEKPQASDSELPQQEAPKQ
ncbi:hypothetical protein B0I35DRAFT_414128 [Stachybotrys elegans]|uniref:Altered inheritance of mitochondria protein 11 n=1 Tax=Stachybotrys elegans TaxID=80388 RepID=A0A8K0WKM3_9HYPO|nr:hypothetical protein B0I35DRAFT_414128 [Stachybotrys elegans]